MRKSDIEHIQRSRFLESGKKIKSQVDNIVRSINLKYPELAASIEFPQGLFNQQGNEKTSESLDMVARYLNILLNKNLFS